MTTLEQSELERFVLDACADYSIDVRRQSATEIELILPASLRRNFGNLERARLTSSQDMRRIDSTLEFLAPGNFIVDCLFELVLGSNAVRSTLVAGLPRRIESEAYVAEFQRRFLGNGDRGGRLPSGTELAELIEKLGFRTYLRTLFDVRVAGLRPVHEVFPIMVSLESGRVVRANVLEGRNLYAVSEYPAVREALPESPDAEQLDRALAEAAEAAVHSSAVLSEEARGATHERLNIQRREVEDHYNSEMMISPDRADQIEREMMAKIQSLDVAERSQISLRPVSFLVIYELVPSLRYVVKDRRGRRHDLDVATIPGRTEIPDDVIRCGHVDRPLVLVPDAGLFCTTCRRECRDCSIGTIESACPRCEESGKNICLLCSEELEDGTVACAEHIFECVSGGERKLEGTQVSCHSCDGNVCTSSDHRIICTTGQEAYCVKCAFDSCSECASCGESICADHGTESSIGRARICGNCVRECVECQGLTGKHQGTSCALATHCNAWICTNHAADLACAICASVTCTSHTKRCAQTSANICPSHAATCKGCQRTLRADIVGQCDGCQATLCGDCTFETVSNKRVCDDCAGLCETDESIHMKSELFMCKGPHGEGSSLFCEVHVESCADCHHPSCEEHAGSSIVSGKVVCSSCASLCKECGELLGKNEGLACTVCDAVYCGVNEDPPRCSEDNAPACPEHLAECDGEEGTFCSDHRETCSVCDTAVRRAKAVQCTGCGSTLCQSHVDNCKHDGLPLCYRCAFRPPMEHGIYCAHHLISCNACGVRTPALGGNTKLCAICQKLSRREPGGQLPFSPDVIEAFVTEHAGWMPKRARTQYYVADACVLVVVQSGIMKKRSYGYFDEAGSQIAIPPPDRSKIPGFEL